MPHTAVSLPLCPCPMCRLSSAIVLLERGRTDMALTLLRPWLQELAEAEAQAREQQQPPPPKRRKAR
mgnify:CR=1 FL=1